MQQTITIIGILILIGIFIALYLWNKKRNKKTVSLEEKHERFNQLLSEKFAYYVKREPPEIGKRYIRNTMDNLYEMGYLHPEIIKEEYNKIVKRESTLSLAQREFIIRIIHDTAIELDQQIENENN